MASRIFGPGQGPRITDLCTATIRAVAQGVVGIAFIQMLLVGVGFVLMGVPGAGLLALAVLHDYPQHYALFNQRSVTIGGRSRPTVNGILGSYSGADGFKTGFTCGSGYNLVASAQRGDRRVIAACSASGA